MRARRSFFAYFLRFRVHTLVHTASVAQMALLNNSQPRLFQSLSAEFNERRFGGLERAQMLTHSHIATPARTLKITQESFVNELSV